ncbi:hypothetical protein CFOL_v3_21145 [Cephalotus follicularis]|uniref:Retrovirus-related Pol polyprotein from transposon TNT 1-94-like beta-barrel domain-containing protein n=1 Tax=Cephalotus follicularis TaxID=3775 RepID=A0A1Q3CBR7_CEPFO|nr:hypothetical protein CFOL_v3_21145 [Cephalotus follicularis]
MIPTLTTRPDPLSFSELHTLLVSHEFLNKSALTKLSLSATSDTPSVNTAKCHPPLPHDPSSVPTRRGQGHSFPGRGSFRGRGHGRRRNTYHGGRGPNMWCNFCQRNNHTNNTCYFREQHCWSGPQSFRPAPPQVNTITPYTNQFPQPQHLWYPDIGATQHVTPNIQSLSRYDSYSGYDQIHVGDGSPLPIHNIGKTSISTSSCTLTLSNVSHVPNMSKSLMSVQKFAQENNVFFEFHPTCFFCQGSGNQENYS